MEGNIKSDVRAFSEAGASDTLCWCYALEDAARRSRNAISHNVGGREDVNRSISVLFSQERRQSDRDRKFTLDRLRQIQKLVRVLG